jgi:LMBR1 domain-containing protein 1
MLLVTSFAVVQLCSTTFGAYARLTAADSIFGMQAENLIFIRYFYRNDAFVYALIVIAALSGCVLGIWPRERRQYEVPDYD